MTRDQFRPPDHGHDHFLLTTAVGSFPRPEWLEPVLELTDDESSIATAEALDDACKAVVSDQERAGLDVVTDGEVRRDGMVEHFAQFVDGYENDGGGSGWNQQMPTVVDTVSSNEPWLVDDFEFATAIAHRPVKTTITGPFTLASFASMEAYDDVETLVYDFADLVADEAARLAEAGAEWIQIDEPALGMSPHADIAHEALARIDDDVPEAVRLGLHVCSGNYGDLAPALFDFPVDEVDLEFANEDADDVAEVFDGVDLGVDVGVGVVDSQSKEVDSAEAVRENVETALQVVPPERLTLTPDCGLKPLPRDAAFAKLDILGTVASEVEAALDAGDVDAARADE